MLKVVAVVDKENSALDRLAKGVAKYHDNLDYRVVAVHPKRPDNEQLRHFQETAIDADIIDWQYFRTAETLRGIYPWLENKKQILTHNNPYSIEEQDWNNYDYNVGNNEYITKRLGEITQKPVTHIPITIDTDFWKFNPDWRFGSKINATNKYEFQGQALNPSVIMVANRIEGKKGILPVAKACADLNLHFVLVGAISNGDYFHEIQRTVGNLEYHDRITDEALRELYYNSMIHVCNSVDNFESGTMPVLESMLTGVPVLSRKVGHVPELYNGENMVIQNSDPDDVENIKKKLLEMISDKKRLIEMRDKAWQTAKSRSYERRAYMYQKLYREVMWPDLKPVSVVVPIYDKPEIIRKCLNAIAEQTYKNIEIIVVDDSGFDNDDLVRDFARYVSLPVRFISNQEVVLGAISDDYGLARARNRGTIEATGEIIVYCDQRQIMEPNAIEEFVKHLSSRIWVYGNKGANKKEFVENFSAVYRHRVIQAGMFCERITQYGGMSEELRKRLNRQGVTTEYVPSAKANPTGKSSNRNRKRQEIINMKNKVWKMYDAE